MKRIDCTPKMNSLRLASCYLLTSLLILFTGCKQSHLPVSEETPRTRNLLTDEALLDSVERRTFLYFWEGAEPNSGLARERFHVDDVYPENDKHVVTSGGSGFGIMTMIAGIDRGYVTREQGVERFERILDFLETADSFHGVFPHWWDGETGKAKGFSAKDNGGDLVETSFLFQGLLALHQYYVQGSAREQAVAAREQAVAARVDRLWRAVDWNWHRNGEDVLFWHWSPEFSWEMNFPIRGYNECLITYILAACSPTSDIPASVYHHGWGGEEERSLNRIR